MLFREAAKEDISNIQEVRNAVKENVLSDPALVSDTDCEDFICRRGKGWVCVIDNKVVGFAIADLQEFNIWALFVKPGFDKMGIGRKLHFLMLDWYFSRTNRTVWLSTAPGTRAEKFYRVAGWSQTGFHGKDELKFEMSELDWRRHKCI